MDDSELKIIAKQIRIDIINTLHEAKSGHPGASLSIVELLTVLFFHTMKKGDKFVLSKGHAVSALYSVFAELGLIEKEELNTYRKINSRLQGHPDMTKIPYLDAGTGALGQGLSIAIGYALGVKISNIPNKVYCIIGDGECQEGQIWEAAMYFPTRKINNLIVIMDKNRFQNEDSIENTLPMKNIDKMWEAFGWNVISINGHNFNEIKNAFKEAGDMIDKPTIIIANTIKGKGIDFMENSAEWHGKTINDNDYEKALVMLWTQ